MPKNLTDPITMGEVADLTQKYGTIHVNEIAIRHVGTWTIPTTKASSQSTTSVSFVA